MADDGDAHLPWWTGSYRFPLTSWDADQDACRDACQALLRATASDADHEARGRVVFKPPRVDGTDVVIDCGVRIVPDGLLPKITPLMLAGLLGEAERITGKDLRPPR